MVHYLLGNSTKCGNKGKTKLCMDNKNMNGLAWLHGTIPWGVGNTEHESIYTIDIREGGRVAESFCKGLSPVPSPLEVVVKACGNPTHPRFLEQKNTTPSG